MPNPMASAPKKRKVLQAKWFILILIALLLIIILIPILHQKDTTPPATPVVTDYGDYTTDNTELRASWRSSDPESGIAEYKYAIGISPESLTGWISVGTQTEIILSHLNLNVGKTYYFGVKARNGAGLWSEVGIGDGIRVVPSIEGEVAIEGETDYSGIHVEVFDLAENLADSTITEANGHYEFVNLPPGHYLAEFSILGPLGYLHNNYKFDTTEIVDTPLVHNVTLSKVPPTYLYVISDPASEAEKTMIAGLQGILAQDNSTENIWVNIGNGYQNWLSDLQDNHRTQIYYSYQNNPWGLVEHFKPYLSNGYILYELGEDSENVATTLAGIYKLLPIDSSLEEKAKAHGLSLGMDVRGKDERWCFENYWDELNHSIVCHQIESIHGCLRDYSIATRAFAFSEGKSRFMREVFSKIEEGGIVLGAWGTCGESEAVLPASQYNLITVPTDYAWNLSVLSAFKVDNITQKNHSSTPETEENVHYVTFVMSDGDNAQWLLNDFSTNPDWYGSPLRGEFPMGWTISPSLVDLAPTVMQQLYNNATAKDFFVAGVSGRGYFYPSNFPDLEEEAIRMDRYLERADLNIVSILDTEYDGFCRENLEPYAAQPNLLGGFWLWYDDYAGRKGDVIFVNGKPFIAAKYNLWEGQENPQSIAQKINTAPADPHSIQGYSVVNVHPWSMGLAEIKQIIDSLNPNVRVVTPEEFILLIRENLSPELFWLFSTDTEGWEGGARGGGFDAARWDHVGNPSGCLYLDGSDLTLEDENNPEPNSWFSREIVLPPTAQHLRFQTRAGHSATDDGRLRVIITDADGEHVLIDWETLAGPEWRNRMADISPWAGQKVIIRFEQDDDGEGSGEMRYIDNAEIIAYESPEASPLLVGAYYYGWYGPESHWDRYTDDPLLGEYDCRDIAIIAQHNRWAEDYGIDFLAMSWWGPGEPTDITLRDYYLPASVSSDVKFCIHYESAGCLQVTAGQPIDFDADIEVDGEQIKRGKKFINDFNYLADTYFDDDQYLKIDGRPVVILYITRDYQNAEGYFAQLKANMEDKDDPYLIADVVYWDDASERDDWGFLGQYFDAITGYNMHNNDHLENFLPNLVTKYTEYQDCATDHGLAFVPGVMPGYDDTCLPDRENDPILRDNGNFYRDFWQIACQFVEQTNPMIMITSFNEWHEGTEIEPSKEYGNFYLEATGELGGWSESS